MLTKPKWFKLINIFQYLWLAGAPPKKTPTPSAPLIHLLLAARSTLRTLEWLQSMKPSPFWAPDVSKNVKVPSTFWRLEPLEPILDLASDYSTSPVAFSIFIQGMPQGI